jgi:hypothetical protein
MKRKIGQELIARMKRFNDSLGAICTPESHTTPHGGSVRGDGTSGENRTPFGLMMGYNPRNGTHKRSSHHNS